MTRVVAAVVLLAVVVATSGAGAPSLPLARGGYVTGGSDPDPEELAWMGRFAVVHAGDPEEPLSQEAVARLRAAGVKILLAYDWLPAGYHYTDGEGDSPYMAWVYRNREWASLNPHGPFPHCTESGYDWCEDYYYDLGNGEVRKRRVEYLAASIAESGYDGIFFDWGNDWFLDDPGYEGIKGTYYTRHPDLPYARAIAAFYSALRAQGIVVQPNQGFRNPEDLLPVVDYDMTESYVTDYGYFSHRLYLEGHGYIEVPETVYYPVSDDPLHGSLADTLYYADYLADLIERYAGPGFRGMVYMNYAAPEYVPTGEMVGGRRVYRAVTPRAAIYYGYAVAKLVGALAYTEVPFDHRLERDGVYFYDLGQPLGESYEAIPGGYVRYYRGGIVVVGKWQEETALELVSPYIPSDIPVYDAFEGEWTRSGPGRLTVRVRPREDPLTGRMAPSGRLYIYAAGAAGEDSDPPTYYVRPDGGPPDVCSGLVDAPYTPDTSPNCAWDHPFRALPPGGPPRIVGGDTLIIRSGSYMMGYGAPGAEGCSADYPWDCHMAPIPSGPDPDHPTRVLGEGWDAGCPAPPELWGTERADMVLNLAGSSNVDIRCLEITDHSGCVEFHTGGLACERDSYPYGPWAAVGLYAADSANVHLKDLNIHGLARDGVWAGRLADWTVEDVHIAGNGWAGWDGDIEGKDSNSGELLFRRLIVEWNGCGETYPEGEPTGCWAQTAGGYGDGLGTGTTGGHWVFEDSAFLHNTSDGLDLLYVRGPGSFIEIRGVHAEGNAGNQIKTSGPVAIENSIIVGNCAYFEGKPFTYNVDTCRAFGNALSITLRPGDEARLVNDTITGEGDCLMEVLCEGACDGSEAIIMRNDILLGQEEFTGADRTCLVYTEGFPDDPLEMDYSVINGVKGDPCPVGPHDICAPPRLAGEGIDSFDAHLLADSPAIDAGDPAFAPADDFAGNPRDAAPDVGAYEYLGSVGANEELLPIVGTVKPCLGVWFYQAW